MPQGADGEGAEARTSGADTGEDAAADGDAAGPVDLDLKAYEEEQRRLDREWYDESTEPDMADFGGADVPMSSVLQKRVSLRQLQYNRDNEAWETNRMLLSGVVQRTGANADLETDEEVHCLPVARLWFINGAAQLTCT